jgi:hypothetical protein
MFLWNKTEPDLERIRVLAPASAVTPAAPLHLRNQRGDLL